MATAVGNSIALTGDPLKDPLLQGGSWSFAGAHTLSYSFNLNFDFDPNTGQPVPGPGGTWTAILSNAFRHALVAWSNVADLSFSEATSENGKYFFESNADIAVALTGNDLQALGAVEFGLGRGHMQPALIVGHEIAKLERPHAGLDLIDHDQTPRVFLAKGNLAIAADSFHDHWHHLAYSSISAAPYHHHARLASGLLAPIGYIPPAEAKAHCYRRLSEQTMSV